jgi:hypothetical protein
VYSEHLCGGFEVSQIVCHEGVYLATPGKMDDVLVPNIPQSGSPKVAKMNPYPNLR